MWSNLTSPIASKTATQNTVATVWMLLLWLAIHEQSLGQSQVFSQNFAAEQSKPATLGEASSPPIASPRSPHEIGTQILHLALHEAVWGPAAYCNVRQSTQAFDHKITGFGKFIRAGQGSGRMKLSLQFPAGDSMNTLIQVSDGQRLHTIEDIGDIRKRTIIDLDKVRRRLVIDSQTIYDPVIAMYLAIGGQAEAIRKLCQQYEWQEVETSMFGGQSVWVLTGEIAAVPPAVRALANTDLELHVHGENSLIPQFARIMIAKTEADAPFAYWVYQIEQWQSANQKTSIGVQAGLRTTIEWPDPALVNEQIAPDFFQPASSNDPLFEETDRYLPPPLSIASQPIRSPESTR